MLWIIYGVGFLALNASVVSAPTHLMTLRNIAYLIIGGFFLIGTYFIKTAMNENKKKIHRISNKLFYKLMFKNKFKIHVGDLAKGLNIGIDDAIEYIESRKKISNGTLSFNDSGNIMINKFRADRNK